MTFRKQTSFMSIFGVRQALCTSYYQNKQTFSENVLAFECVGTSLIEIGLHSLHLHIESTFKHFQLNKNEDDMKRNL